MLANAKFLSFYCKHGSQNIQSDCHQWLSDSFRVHKIRFRPGLYPGPHWGSLQRFPRPPSSFKGPYLLRGREGRRRGKGEEGKGRDPPPFANSWIHPWTSQAFFFCMALDPAGECVCLPRQPQQSLYCGVCVQPKAKKLLVCLLQHTLRERVILSIDCTQNAALRCCPYARIAVSCSSSCDRTAKHCRPSDSNSTVWCYK